jgi:hypothetical protein
MYLTGIADEASQDGNVQISTTLAMGWNAIEATLFKWEKSP